MKYKTRKSKSKKNKESKIQTLKAYIRLGDEALSGLCEKKRKTEQKEIEKDFLEFLWSLLIKARAGFKSELSGQTSDLQSHHLVGKGTTALRYSLENGICCTVGEHRFGFHGTQYRQELMRRKVKRLRGENTYHKLMTLKTVVGKTLKKELQRTLINELKLHKDEIKKYFNHKNYKGTKAKKLYEKMFHLMESRE